MPILETSAAYKLFCSGDDLFLEMLAAIDASQTSICLEMYIFSDQGIGQKFRDALVRAQQRGVKVRALVDALGSLEMAGDFWEPLKKAGGEACVFNPLALHRVWIRNHRKLLVCDDRVAFIGGFNIAPEYEGDGVARGWRDIGMKIEGPLASQLRLSFDEMFERAEFRHKRFSRLLKSGAKKTVARPDAQLLFSGPGRGQNPVKRALHDDLDKAKDVKIIVGYFLPTRRLRRELAKVVRRGGRVQLMLAGKSDVPLSQLAARSLYRRLLNRGVEIYEYQPQVLHAKLVIVDDAVYVGSANLDQRSLRINYELMVRSRNPELLQQAQEIFDQNLKRCRRIEPAEWRASRSIWQRFKQRLACWLLVQVDPWMARWQWRSLPE
jgi:cardiolipin synthase